MRNGDHLRNDIRAALGEVPAPRADISAILARRTRDEVPPRPPRAAYAIAIAAAFAIALISLAHAGAVVAAVTSDVARFLRVVAIPSNPPVPTTLVRQLKAEMRPIDFADAKAAVPFVLVAPSGLPSDARATRMELVTAGEWSAATKRWMPGAKEVHWTYARPGGRTFVVVARRYDPRERFSAYLWEALDGANSGVRVPAGSVAVIRHEQFFWRNGDQVMSAVASDALSIDEIARIRSAMHGTPIAGVHTQGPQGGARFVIIRR